MPEPLYGRDISCDALVVDPPTREGRIAGAAFPCSGGRGERYGWPRPSQAGARGRIAGEACTAFVKGAEALEPEKGQLEAAVSACGEERERRLAQRAAREGRDNDFAAFLLVSDLDTGQLALVSEPEEGSPRVTVSHCPFAAACREWGLGEYGKYFCRGMDAAIMRGYNPERYETACERDLSEGTDTCLIVYRLCP